MDKVTFSDDSVVTEMKDVLAYSVDSESEAGRPIAKRYNVRSLPALVFLSPDGSARDALSGFQDPQEFVAEVRRIKRDEGTVGDLRRRVEATPDDLETRYELATKLMDLGDQAGHDEQIAAIERLDPEGTSAVRRRMQLEEILVKVRQNLRLEPLYEFLGQNDDPRVLFTGWYFAWLYEGQLLAKAKETSAIEGHRERWIRAGRMLWQHVPAEQRASVGNAIAWRFYERRETLPDDVILFALEVAEKAAELASDDPNVVDTLACCQYAAGKLELARRTVERCIAMDPQNPEWKKRRRQFTEE